MDRGEALRIVTVHLPTPMRRWLRWRMVCVQGCGRHPCGLYEAALDELAKPWRGRRP